MFHYLPNRRLTAMSQPLRDDDAKRAYARLASAPQLQAAWLHLHAAAPGEAGWLAVRARWAVAGRCSIRILAFVLPAVQLGLRI